MSSVKKTININPDLFTMSKRRSQTKKKERKIKPKAFIKPNTLKKALLKRIKDHQKEATQKREVEKQVEEFSTDFHKSLDYLQELSKKKNTEKTQKKNKTLKQPISEGSTSQPHVDIELPHELVETHVQTSSTSIKPDVPYGCLKGGTKPTYRTWKNKTLKKNDRLNIQLPEKTETERQQKLRAIKNNFKNSQEKNMILPGQKIKQKKLKTTTKTYKLGRKGGTVSVLIKNRQTRKRVQKEHGLLKQRSINEIKKYLHNKNLLKAGSNAPNDVVRTTYEQAVLAGDVNNTGKDVTIHNFMNT